MTMQIPPKPENSLAACVLVPLFDPSHEQDREYINRFGNPLYDMVSGKCMGRMMGDCPQQPDSQPLPKRFAHLNRNTNHNA